MIPKRPWYINKQATLIRDYHCNVVCKVEDIGGLEVAEHIIKAVNELEVETEGKHYVYPKLH